MTVGRIPSIEGGIQPTIVDAKGDLIGASAADTPARLAVGANNTVLTADSAEATGLKWVAPAGGDFTLVSRTSFSNVAGQEFSDVFSATYPTYRIIIETLHAGTAADIAQFQVKTSGGVQTASYYGASAVLVHTSSSVSTVANSSNISAFKLNSGGSGNSSDTACNFAFDIVNAGASGRPRWMGVGVGGNAGNVNWFGGYRAATETVTGFKLSGSTSNITGTVAIYGYGA